MESDNLIDIGLRRSAELNSTHTQMSAQARHKIMQLAGGHPHFLQQVCYSAFARDNDDYIDESDVQEGVFDRNGALELLGNRYYSELFFQSMNDSQRTILRILAENRTGWTTHADLASRIGAANQGDELDPLLERHIVLRGSGRHRGFRISDEMFSLWITVFGGGADGTTVSWPPSLGPDLVEPRS